MKNRALSIFHKMKFSFFFSVMLLGTLPLFSCIKEEDIVWCHATLMAPTKNILVPGSVPKAVFDDPAVAGYPALVLERVQKAPQPRFTLHGALNTLSVPGDFRHAADGKVLTADREGYPYAILIPYAQVKDQVLGGYHEDVILAGSVPLEQATILVRAGYPLPQVSCREIVQLEEKVSLREGLQKLLQTWGKPYVETLPAHQQTLGALDEQQAEDLLLRHVKPEQFHTFFNREATKEQYLASPQVRRRTNKVIASHKNLPRFPHMEFVNLTFKGATLAKEAEEVFTPAAVPQLNWLRHDLTEFGQFERSLACSLLHNTRAYIVTPHLMPWSRFQKALEGRRSYSQQDLLKNEDTMIDQNLEILRKVITGKLANNARVLKEFEQWRTSFHMWKHYIVTTERELKSKTPSQTLATDEASFNQRLDTINAVIKAYVLNSDAPAAE